MKFFRPAASPHQTALAMVGAKSGGTVIVVGAADPALAAEIALVTGLNGRTLVVVPAANLQPQIDAAAAKAGALVDVEPAPATALPAADGTFDIAVITDFAGADREPVVREAARTVRPGGRVVVIEGKRTGGLRKLWSSGVANTPAAGDDIIAALSAAGLRGARLLGTAEGISYFEGTK